MTYTDTTLSDSGTTVATRNRWRALRHSGMTTRPTIRAEDGDCPQRPPVSGRQPGALKAAPRYNWWISARATAAYRQDVDGVPRLVPHPRPGGLDGESATTTMMAAANMPYSVGKTPAKAVTSRRTGTCVEARVADQDEGGVQEDQPEQGKTGPAVPGGEPVHADPAVQPRQPGDQHELQDHHQGGVQAQELRHPDQRVLRGVIRPEHGLDDRQIDQDNAPQHHPGFHRRMDTGGGGRAAPPRRCGLRRALFRSRHGFSPVG